jgi:hypothetical protein
MLGSAAITSVLLLALAWLCREWIAARLKASLELETAKKLAEFTRRLDAAEARIVAARDAGIETNLQLSAVVLAERVAAIKALWQGIIDWRAATALNMIVAAMTTDYVRRHGDNEATARAARQMLDAIHHNELLTATNKLNYWRPFVTERAWAMFFAYHTFHVVRVTRATALMLRQHEMAIRLWEVNSELSVVRASAPHLAVQYEAEPIGTTSTFLAYVEAELLAELQKSLAGEHSGAEAARQAAAIVATATTAVGAAQPAPVLPQ